MFATTANERARVVERDEAASEFGPKALPKRRKSPLAMRGRNAIVELVKCGERDLKARAGWSLL